MQPASGGATLVDRIYLHGRELGSTPALQDAMRSVSWSVLDAETNRIANALRAADLRKGDRVALMAGPSVESALLLLGILKAGGSAVPIPTLVGSDAIARIMADCAARVLFVSESCRGCVTPALTDPPLLTVAVGFACDGWMPLARFTESAGTDAPDVQITLQDEFNIIYSSGTTGRPKGIVLNHALRADSVPELMRRSVPQGARTITTTALYSNWTIGALVYTLWVGGCTRLTEKFSPAALVSDCRTFEPNNVFLVPVQIARLLDDPVASVALPHLAPCMKWSAGSHLAAERKRVLMERWAGGFTEIYGMTEGAPFTMLHGDERPDKLHTVGRSDPPEDIKIIGDDDRELPVGSRGEIVGRARGVMTGYNNQREANEAILWRDHDGHPYFRSGDIGSLDEEGFLQITDRKKDMIISGGFNIYASDLEAVLLAHPAIAEAAVFGVCSAKWDETPAAAVVLKDGSSQQERDLLDWANARLGRLQRLSALVLTDALPRGSLDKVLKRELRTKYAYLGDSSQGIT